MVRTSVHGSKKKGFAEGFIMVETLVFILLLSFLFSGISGLISAKEKTLEKKQKVFFEQLEKRGLEYESD